MIEEHSRHDNNKAERKLMEFDYKFTHNFEEVEKKKKLGNFKSYSKKIEGLGGFQGML